MLSFWHIERIVETRPFGRVTDQDVLDTLEASFKKLLASTSRKSLLRKYLTKNVFDKMKYRKTRSGATFYDVIKSGVEVTDSKIGLYAVDKDCYKVFEDIFNPVLAELHGGFQPNDRHPDPCFGDVGSVRCLDTNQHYVLSCTIFCSRNLKNFSFGTRMSESDYKEIEAMVSNVVSSLENELKGEYHTLLSLTRNSQERLLSYNFLLTRDDRYLAAADWFRFWPTGRGVFHNRMMDLAVWANGEDHVTVISSQRNGDLYSVYGRLVRTVQSIGSKLEFAHDDRLGYVTCCPSKLGTGMKAELTLKLPNLSERRDVLRKFADEFNLDIGVEDVGKRGVMDQAEEEAKEDIVVKVRNKRYLGVTEFDMIAKLQEGVLKMIKMEKELQTEF